MAYVAKKFDNERELIDYLNDVVLGKALLTTVKVQSLHGKTFIVHDGVADRTCTFTDTTGEGLLPKQILDQIKAAHANLLSGVSARDYQHDTPATVRVAVVTPTYTVKGTGTANVILGFPSTDTIVGANAVVKADIINIFTAENNRIGVIHE